MSLSHDDTEGGKLWSNHSSAKSPKAVIVGESVERRFGRRLREIREASGVSQEELAGQAGVHRTYVGLLERGERNVTLRTIERIAAALGVEMADLMPRRGGGRRETLP